MVEPGILTAIQTPEPFQWTPPDDGAKTSGRRLAFVRWLTQSDHPLTARVMVNRIWLHHFGEGIVSSPEDFGEMGSFPSHPGLLDWLAREFVESGWSIKHMHRLMMNSTAYRQQSALDQSTHSKAIAVDPENRLLWRQRLRRLEAESVRDAVLSTAGLLDTSQFGGVSRMARHPDGEVTVVEGGNNRRRSIYLQVLRSNPLTFLQEFDQPVMETNCLRRSRSTVATQALTLINSDTMSTAAESMSDRLLQEFPDSPLAAAVMVAFSRQASAEELEMLSQFVQSQQEKYAATGSPPGQAHRQAMVDSCHMLLAANEFVYID